jgi:transposase
MITSGQNVNIVIAAKSVDFRKCHDGLAAVAQNELGLVPHCGFIIVFRAKRADRIKILPWDGTGLVLTHCRHSRQVFMVQKCLYCGAKNRPRGIAVVRSLVALPPSRSARQMAPECPSV